MVTRLGQSRKPPLAQPHPPARQPLITCLAPLLPRCRGSEPTARTSSPPGPWPDEQPRASRQIRLHKGIDARPERWSCQLTPQIAAGPYLVVAEERH